MTCRATRRLHEDHCHLHDEADGGHIGGETGEAGARLDKPEQPNKGEAVKADGDGEFGWFQPRRRTGDDAMIEQDSGESREKSENHRHAQERQRPIGEPSALQEGLTWISCS